MSMKTLLVKTPIAVFLGILCLWFSSCSKSDSPYYDYKNDVQSFNGTTLEYLQAQPSGTFDSLLLVLDRLPDLKDSLNNSQVTLFAPVNLNFAAAMKYLNLERRQLGEPELSLSTVDAQQLDTLVARYIIRGVKTTDDYIPELDGLLLTSIAYNYPMHVRYVKLSASGFESGGASAVDFSNPFGSNINKDWITTRATTVNIKTTNGTINILSAIHSFGFGEFTDRMNFIEDEEDEN